MRRKVQIQVGVGSPPGGWNSGRDADGWSSGDQENREDRWSVIPHQLLRYLCGLAVSGPILDDPDVLALAHPNRTRVLAGELIGLLNDFAVVGIGIMMFPILKKYDESLALGYVGFRVIEAALLIVGRVSLLPILTISREFIAAGSPSASHFQTLGASALAGRFWASEVAGVVFIVTALILYSLAYRSKILPRFISIWGLIGALGIAVVLGLDMLEISAPAAAILALPIISNELFLAVWLIVKGFNSPANAS